jgi:hypothetical protein
MNETTPCRVLVCQYILDKRGYKQHICECMSVYVYICSCLSQMVSLNDPRPQGIPLFDLRLL